MPRGIDYEHPPCQNNVGVTNEKTRSMQQSAQSQLQEDPQSSTPARKPPGSTSDHLANERTFLAWIRTSIAVIGLGFVVARFSVWLRELAVRVDEPIRPRHIGLSLPLGIAMMCAGGLLALVAAWRYRKVANAIEQGTSAKDSNTIAVVTLMVLVITAALVIYMLATA
jgi:putative membrane protein